MPLAFLAASPRCHVGIGLCMTACSHGLLYRAMSLGQHRCVPLLAHTQTHHPEVLYPSQPATRALSERCRLQHAEWPLYIVYGCIRMEKVECEPT